MNQAVQLIMAWAARNHRPAERLCSTGWSCHHSWASQSPQPTVTSKARALTRRGKAGPSTDPLVGSKQKGGGPMRGSPFVVSAVGGSSGWGVGSLMHRSKKKPLTGRGCGDQGSGLPCGLAYLLSAGLSVEGLNISSSFFCSASASSASGGGASICTLLTSITASLGMNMVTVCGTKITTATSISCITTQGIEPM